MSSKRYPSRLESRAGFFASTRDECLSPRVRLECNPEIPPPPAWLFPIVWTILFTLMGISAARVYLSECREKGDALFIYGTQLAVNFLWTVFYFSFTALALSFFWLIFLIALVLLMLIRFERCTAGAGKLQLPYLIWLGFAAYLNLATWLLNRA